MRAKFTRCCTGGRAKAGRVEVVLGVVTENSEVLYGSRPICPRGALRQAAYEEEQRWMSRRFSKRDFASW